MLTNQLIGAAHNAQNHSPRQAASPDTAVLSIGSVTPTNAAPDGETTSAIKESERMGDTRPGQDDRPRLQIPKRIEMRVAVIDTIPDAVPESIYDAKAIREPEPESNVREPQE